MKLYFKFTLTNPQVRISEYPDIESIMYKTKYEDIPNKEKVLKVKQIMEKKYADNIIHTFINNKETILLTKKMCRRHNSELFLLTFHKGNIKMFYFNDVGEKVLFEKFDLKR